MPNYFFIYRKSDPARTPVPFAQIDQELCKYLNVVPDKERFYHGWYDNIGDMVSLGYTFSEIKNKIIEIKNKPEYLKDTSWNKLLKVAEWFEEGFLSEAWYDRRRPEGLP